MTHDTSDETLLQIAKVKARGGDPAAALLAAQRINDGLYRSQALAAIADVQAQAGDSAAALLTAERILSPWHRAGALCEVALAQAQMGPPQSVKKTFATAIAAAHEMSRDLEDLLLGRIALAEWRASLIHGLQHGYISTADEMIRTSFVREAVSGALKVVGQAAIAVLQLDATATSSLRTRTTIDREATRAKFDALLESACAIDRGLVPQADLLGALAFAQAHLGDFAGACLTAQRIYSEWDRSKALLALTEIEAQLEEFIPALETVATIENVWLRARAFAAIARRQAQAREFASAHDTAGKIEDKTLRDEVLATIGVAQAQAGVPLEALRTAEGIQEASARVQVLGAVAQILRRMLSEAASMNAALEAKLATTLQAIESGSVTAELVADIAELLSAVQPGRQIPRLDRVRFSAFAPPMVRQGGRFLLFIWAYELAQYEAMLRQATEAGRLKEAGNKGPVKLLRGSEITVCLDLPDFSVEETVDTILWDGEIGNAHFTIKVPADIQLGRYPGTGKILCRGLQIARLGFEIEVGRNRPEPQPLQTTEQRIRSVFASYANEDRVAVLQWARGAQAVGVDVFIDVLSLREGENWERVLLEQIRTRDLFALFWSEPASKSPWVEKEWRCALVTRGPDYIHPVPLADPRVVPPPKELASSKHFNDLTRIVIEYETLMRSGRSTGPYRPDRPIAG